MYLSLDEARDELRRRLLDQELRAAVRTELGAHFMEPFENSPVASADRHLLSPDNGIEFFHQGSRYIGATPLHTEFTGDLFVVINEEKKGLGRIRLTLDDGSRATVDIIDFHANEGKSIGECVLRSGEPLVDFHHRLFEFAGYTLEFLDTTAWRRRLGRSAQYYYYLLLHFVAHGVLFQTFSTQSDSNEQRFFAAVVSPAIERIKRSVGIAPMIVRAFPENQTPSEDFYWWSYPPRLNAYLIDYALQSGLKFRHINLNA